MKKAFSRGIAVLLALMLSVSAFSLSVFAAETPDAAPSESVTEATVTEQPTEPTAAPTAAPEPQAPGAPVIQYNNEPTNTGVSVTVTAADALDSEAKIYYRIAEGEWMEYSEAFPVEDNCIVSAKVVSGANLQSAIAQTEITCIDKIPPTRPTIVADNTTWTKSSVAVTLTNGSDNESGYLRNEYRLGTDGAWLEDTGSIILTAPSVLYVRAVDKALNYSEEVYMNFSNFDFTAPDVSGLIVTPSNDKGPKSYGSSAFSTFFTGFVSCTIDGATDSQSGVAYYEYQPVPSSAYINDAAWKKYDSANPPKITSDFIGYIYARAYDSAGNVSKPVPSVGIVLDSTAPVIGDVVKSTTAVTDEKINVTFSVTENISIDYVTVNGEYVGIYTPSFVAFRNGEYVVVACDKAGNSSTSTIIIDNIQTTPFNTLKIADSLTEEEYTPSSWANMQKFAAELRNLLAIETNESIINSAADQLTTALEALVRKGDGTYAKELIDRVNSLDKALYTEASWAYVEEALAKLNTVMENEESSQLDIDNARADLEAAITGLVVTANFTALDRIIATVEKIDPEAYPADRYHVLMSKVDEAKALPRTDTDQATVDRYYSEILTLMGELNINEIPDGTEEDGKFNLIHMLIIGVIVLIIAVAVAIILILNRAGKDDDDDDNDGGDSGEKAYFYEATPARPTAQPQTAAHQPIPSQQNNPAPASHTQSRPVPGQRYEGTSRPRTTNRTSSASSNPDHASFGDIHFGDEGEYSDWE